MVNTFADKTRAVCVVNLGCHKNLVDAEIILSLLDDAGYIPVANPDDAGTIIVNTCGFLAAAREESLETLLEMSKRRRTGSLKRLVVTGCMADRDRGWLLQRVKRIDQFISPFQLQRFPELMQKNAPVQAPLSPDRFQWADGSRWVATPRSFGFIKIADGCDNRCAYCRIPYLRGSFRSKPLEDILDEATGLIQTGRREIVLISQDSTSYGKDTDGNENFFTVVNRVAALEGVRRLRLMYLYPARIDDRLLRMIDETDTVCRYLDIPLQHADPRVLKKMNRQVPGDPDKPSRSSVIDFLSGIHQRVPGITIRTTLMTGFPGEDETAFRVMMECVESGLIDHLGVFVWSPEPDTAAEKWISEAVSADEAESRAAELMAAQAEIVAERNRGSLGRLFEVVVDAIDEEDPEYSIGRMESQAPEVDGMVRIKGKFEPGEWLRVRLVDVDVFDFDAVFFGYME